MRHPYRSTALILLFVLVLLITDNRWKFPKLQKDIFLVTPLWNWFQDSHINYGLDLQGGTQLDYEIDLSDATKRNSDADNTNDVNIPSLLAGVQAVIDKRVNSLGVSEPNIYLSSAGSEQHIVVELPGVKDLEQAKKRVGNVVQLDFRTQKDKPTKEEEIALQSQASEFLKKLQKEKTVADLNAFAKDVVIPNRVEVKKDEKVSLAELPKEIQSAVKTLALNTFFKTPIKAKEMTYTIVQNQAVQPEGYNILRVTAKAKELRKIPVNAVDFETIAKERQQSLSKDYLKEENVSPKEVSRKAKTLEKGEISDLIKTDQGWAIAKMIDKREAGKTPEIRAEHILFRIKDGSKDAEKEVIRKKAEDVLTQLKAHPEQFEDLARKNSDDSSKDKGGDLGFADPSNYVPEFRDAALKLKKGEMTQELVKSQFGYHIIKLLDKKEPSEVLYQVGVINFGSDEGEKKANEILRRLREEEVYTVERVWFNAASDPWQKTELDYRYFKRANVETDPNTLRPFVSISFTKEGGDIFAKLTEQNIKKPLGIFVGGEFISAPIVQDKITGGSAQITLGESNPELALKEANDLATSLNAGSIPAPLKKPNELTVGASLGSEALDKSLKAGFVGLALVSLFMLLYYRFLGVLASVALSIYGLFLVFLIQSEVHGALAIVIALSLWIGFVVQLIRSKMDGLGKIVFLLLSIVGAAFVYNVLISPIVLTLAGVAGVILSIGMAVDANILIFERMKEEFALGKSFVQTVHDGFDRAWSSILDSNVSSLITCAILYAFGTSIIQGFAMNLAAGIVVSMFTAITVTKTFILLFQNTKLERIHWLWKRK